MGLDDMDDMTKRRLRGASNLFGTLAQGISNLVDVSTTPDAADAFNIELKRRGLTEAGCALIRLPLAMFAFSVQGFAAAKVNESIIDLFMGVADKSDQNLLMRAAGGCDCPEPGCPRSVPLLSVALRALQIAYTELRNFALADVEDAPAKAREIGRLLLMMIVESGNIG